MNNEFTGQVLNFRITPKKKDHDAAVSDEPLALPAEAANPEINGGVQTLEVDG